MDLKDRVTELTRIDTADILNNDSNPSDHPPAQRAVMAALLAEIGKAGALLAYCSERNGGALTLLDGHLRKEDFPGVWPVLILDLNDKEADLLLATHDAVTGMATVIASAMSELSDRIETNSEPIRALIERQKAESDLAALMAQLSEDLVGTEGGGADGRGAGLASGRASVRPVIWIDDVMSFEQALQATGNPCRGEAVIDVCKFYLENHGEETG